MMEEKPKHFLYSAALFVTDNPYIIYTVLGSCVAVCVWGYESFYVTILEW